MTEPYRVYLAAASTPGQIERVQLWTARLRSAGVTVTSTWPSTVTAVGAGNPRDATVAQRRGWAVQELRELERADALWLLAPPNGVTTRGAWVELGVAYTRAMLVVSSGDTRQSIFTALTEEFATDEDAFRALLLVAAGRAER